MKFKKFVALDVSIERLEILFVTTANYHEMLISALVITVCLIRIFFNKEITSSCTSVLKRQNGICTEISLAEA